MKSTKAQEIKKYLTYTTDQINNIVNKVVELLEPEQDAEGLLRFYINEMATTASSTADFNTKLDRFIQSSFASN